MTGSPKAPAAELFGEGGAGRSREQTGQHPSAYGGETAALSGYSNHVVSVGLCGQFVFHRVEMPPMLANGAQYGLALCLGDPLATRPRGSLGGFDGLAQLPLGNGQIERRVPQVHARAVPCDLRVVAFKPFLKRGFAVFGLAHLVEAGGINGMKFAGAVWIATLPDV